MNKLHLNVMHPDYKKLHDGDKILHNYLIPTNHFGMVLV